MGQNPSLCDGSCHQNSRPVTAPGHDRSMKDERRLAELARRQHGLVTLAQAREAGVSVESARRRVNAGRWTRVTAGVFALAGTADTWRRRTFAALLAAGPGAVASHSTAAVLFGMPPFRFQRVEITVPRGRSHRSQIAVVHVTTDLDRGDVATKDGIPVTRPARTLIDLAGAASKSALEEAVDDALIRRLVTLHRLEDRAAALRGPGRSGSILPPAFGAWPPWVGASFRAPPSISSATAENWPNR